MNVLTQLKQKHNTSGGHCGLYLSHFNVEINALKKELNQLHKENKITVHDGIHGKLIMYKE